MCLSHPGTCRINQCPQAQSQICLPIGNAVNVTPFAGTGCECHEGITINIFPQVTHPYERKCLLNT